MTGVANTSPFVPDDGDYRMLVNSGHGAAKCAEIVFDSKRGCDFAQHWITQLRATYRASKP